MILRPVYVMGSIFLAVSVMAILTYPREHDGYVHPGVRAAAAVDPSDAASWFRKMKPYCNWVEVEASHQGSPPPATEQGAAYSAACYALAGKIDRARELILTAPAANQWKAAGIVFNVGHPVADAGDDESAGPIMELVLEFWPNHYMALYHAGMSQYILGDHARARTHLENFLKYYEQDDGWRRNALAVLAKLQGR